MDGMNEFDKINEMVLRIIGWYSLSNNNAYSLIDFKALVSMQANLFNVYE